MAAETHKIDDARDFLDALAANGVFTFQTFDESEAKRPSLSKVLHGTLKQHATKLLELNSQGAGVFVMVCQGDAKGRKAENVTKVRAVFIDLDGGALAPVGTTSAPPHITVESSPGRYHAYWLVDDCEPDIFSSLQKALAKRFDGDASVHDLPRVMRVPGFLHQKGAPFLAKLISTLNRAPYSIAELIAELRLEVIAQGGRNNALTRAAGALRGAGWERDAINAELHVINETQCTPPLSAGELDSIATSIARYPPNASNGSHSRQVFDHPAFLLNANDVLSKEDFILMDLAELGLMLKLMCTCWVNGTAPKDPSKLARILRLSETEISQSLTANVLTQFEEDEDGRLYSPYLRDHRQREMEKRGKRAESGRKGGKATHAKHRYSTCSSIASAALNQ